MSGNFSLTFAAPDGCRDGMKAMYADYNDFGFPGGNALVLRAVLGREPRTLQQYLSELN